jgi:glycosyltransferase involved in cell wall biosynthesis
VSVAIDATYSVGRNLTGVGVYSREILSGLTWAHPEERFLLCYRPHRFLRSLGETLPRNASRRLLRSTPPRADLFHSLNQRLDWRAHRAVATFHDLFVMTGDYSTPEFRERFTRQAREAAERSDLVIAVSEFTASQVETLLGVERARIRTVHHGVRMPALGTQPREKLILFVGAIQRRKNVARLVRAFACAPPDWHLALAGDANGFGAAEELAAVESSPRRKDIQVLGYVSSSEMDGLYRRASIFAFPSLDEGFGMPVLDAMAYGVPVLASGRSAIPELVRDAGLLVDPLDTDALASALERLTSDENLRQELARRGLRRASEFSWEAAVGKTWAVYAELR